MIFEFSGSDLTAKKMKVSRENEGRTIRINEPVGRENEGRPEKMKVIELRPVSETNKKARRCFRSGPVHLLLFDLNSSVLQDQIFTCFSL